MSTIPETISLGLSYYQSGNYPQSEGMFRQVLDIDPANADVWCCLGIVCRAQGKLDEAVRSYQQALRLKPHFPEVQNNLGNALLGQKKYTEAIDCYQQVLRLQPNNAEPHHNLGVALRDLGRYDEAIAQYDEALRINPNYADAHNSLGDALIAKGRYDEAIEHLRRALQLRPQLAEAHNNLGVALEKKGKLDEPVAHYHEALKYKPDYADAHSNLGNVLAAQQKPDEALAHYQQAVRLQPDSHKAHFNLGVAQALQSKLDEALASYREALRVKPDYPDAHLNLGNILQARGEFEEALACYDQALSYQPDHPEAHMARAMTRLRLGQFEEGWPEYEWRWQCKEFVGAAFAQPRWDGTPLDGRTILLHAEQGIGDVLHFIRYAPLVKQRDGQVLVGCPESLIPLLSRCTGIDRLAAQSAELPPFDVHASLLSLPAIFATTLQTIPADVPYLFAEEDRVAHWQRELNSDPDFKVGICWQGNPKYRSDRERSIPLHQFAPLAQVPGVRLYSLQKGPGTEQLATLAGAFPITDLSNRLEETRGAFTDTAAVMKNLDLVVTADTALAHLAGALAVPVWTALAFVPDSRWLWQREDTPWYPTMRLFRQTSPGNWDEVFRRLAGELQKLAAHPVRPRPILVEVAPGELIDKITILEIKQERLPDPGRARHVADELALLTAARTRCTPSSEELDRLTAELKRVNVAIWQVEDDIRACERDGDFSQRFIELARSVYRQNDRRAALKRRINELLQSRIREEKSYPAYEGQ